MTKNIKPKIQRTLNVKYVAAKGEKKLKLFESCINHIINLIG